VHPQGIEMMPCPINMQQFKFNEDSFNKFLKKWRTITILIMAIVLVIIAITNSLSNKSGDISVTAYTILLMAAFYGFNIYRGFKRQKKVMAAYSVTISEEGITREQYNTSSLHISFMEIKEIIKTKRGGYMIKGRDRTDVILIPRFIDDPEALEKALATMAPISYGGKAAAYRKLAPILSLVAIAMVIGVITLDNEIIVTVCAAIAIGLAAWGFYEIQRNKNVPHSAKRSSWFIIFYIVLIIYMAYSKLTGTWAH
jgi:hypothetical protein